jgi:hypothetical protein
MDGHKLRAFRQGHLVYRFNSEVPLELFRKA